MRIINLFSLIFAFLYTGSLLAEPETYIRSYHYQASETDSKLTAQTAAISQVHHLLLGELGTYINSRIDITKTSSGRGFSQQDITSLTAGIIKTEILEESWDGNEYFVRAKLVADPDDIAKKLGDPHFIEEQQKAVKNRSANEMEYWRSISMSGSAEMFRAYLDKYPDGQFKELALLNIKQINDRVAKEKLDAERRDIEQKLLIQALSKQNGQTSQSRNALILDAPGKITIVARHDAKSGSKKTREEVTYLLVDALYKQVSNVVPKGTEIIKVTDFDKTKYFLYGDQEGKESNKICSQNNSNLVITGILEDHEGSQGFLREMSLSIFDCELRKLSKHQFLPDFGSGGRFKREASVKKEFRVFIHDYIDSI